MDEALEDLKEQADSFYSESNQAHLRKAIADLEAGKGQFHDLIETDEE